MNLPSLPIDEVLPRLIHSLRTSNCAVLQAATGAGKTTRVPTSLWKSEVAGEGRILVLEPRRIAARAAARRMSQELGTVLGETVGYQVRFEQRCTVRTSVLVVTDGILLRYLQEDPFLEHPLISAIIFDEFHERSINVDLALAMCRRVQETVRPDLKLVVMSATLNTESISRYLGNCPVLKSEGRLFPVAIRYLPYANSQPLPNLVAQSVDSLLPETPGDLLVFLPGIREIQQSARALSHVSLEQNLDVLPLYGDLTSEQQDQVLEVSDRRKIVLATNVAETSLTIPGVTGVIDTGLVRQMQFDAGLGLDRLVLTKVSQASADQRAGRAGRLQPGTCIRLWMEREHRGLPVETESEIRRVDLTGAMLQLLCWGETDVEQFPWFEFPRLESLTQSRNLLHKLGAIAQDGKVTDLGHHMGRLPVQPRLARLLIESQRLGIPHRGAWIAALLTERDPFERSSRKNVHHSCSDVLDRIVALEEFKRTGREETSMGRVHGGSAYGLAQVQQQLAGLLQEAGQDNLISSASKISPDEAVLRSIMVAFPDRIARRREPLSRRGIMVGGRGVRLAESSAVMDRMLFVCVDTDAGQGEALVHLASGIDSSWFSAESLSTSIDVTFDTELERIVAYKRIRYEDLILEQSVTTPPPEFDPGDTLARAAAEQLDRVFPYDDPATAAFIARVECLRRWVPNCELQPVDDLTLRQLIPEMTQGCRSFRDLKAKPWLDALRRKFSYQELQFIDREAPERIRVPSGSQVVLTYEVGRPPILAVRIQELFGWSETPRVGRGQVPVLLHLLAPNYRPQQITDDLKSFWNNTYPEVRKELRRRYPKHAWPDDPWTARAEFKPGKRS